jgi:hypothetical protein
LIISHHKGPDMLPGLCFCSPFRGKLEMKNPGRC